jgi:hypothetical protein
MSAAMRLFAVCKMRLSYEYVPSIDTMVSRNSENSALLWSLRTFDKTRFKGTDVLSASNNLWIPSPSDVKNVEAPSTTADCRAGDDTGDIDAGLVEAKTSNCLTPR